MTKNNLETLSRIVLFRDRETEPGTPATTGAAAVDLDQGSLVKSAWAVEHNLETIHGSELPTRLYASHREASGTLSQKMAKPDFIAFALAYFFGSCESAPLSETAYQHEISPASGLELPSFTIIQKWGAGIFAERLSGNYLEGFSLELGEGWVSCSAEVLGTGHREVNYEHEVVSAAANASSITLAQNRVAGATGEERKANVYRVRAKDYGSSAWTALTVSDASGDQPAVITFAQALGQSANQVDYHVDYLPEEPAWCSLPDPVDESPLRVVDAKILVDAHWNGSALEGGEDLSAEVTAFALKGKNNLELRRFPGAAGPAGKAVRGNRELAISLTRNLRDTILAWQADNPETERLSVSFLLQGAEIDPGSGIRFGAELIFPSCGILSAPLTVQGKRLALAGDLVVLDDGENPSAVIRCYNQQRGYL